MHISKAKQINKQLARILWDAIEDKEETIPFTLSKEKTVEAWEMVRLYNLNIANSKRCNSNICGQIPFAKIEFVFFYLKRLYEDNKD